MSRLLLALALVSCNDPSALAPGDAPSFALVSGDGLDLSDAELPGRYILRRALGKDCTDVLPTGWTVEPLFDADAHGFLPPFLRRYCVLELDPTAASPDLPSTFAVYGTAEPDVLAVAAMGGIPTGAQLGQSFLQQVRPFPNYTAVPAYPAWLTLVDTSPTFTPGDPNAWQQAGTYDHGQRLATLALRATCDGVTTPTSTPDCVVDIGTELAVAWNMTTSGPMRSSAGGVMGSPADLARAIERAVVAWQDAPSAGPLVLNLALGWHRESTGEDLATATPAVLAVYEALLHASCKDALVTAAVGQIDTPWGEPQSEEPLLPAWWETKSAPSAATCSAALGAWWTAADVARGASTSPYTPLIYGISAYDVSYVTLANQRPGSTTPHAAPGAQLDYYNAALGGFTTPISGTSASSAMVASAAAVIRSHRPLLDAHEVMEVLRNASATSGTPAEFCNNPTAGCDDTHYISVCESLVSTCAAGGCPPTYTAAACAAIPTAAPITPTGSAFPDTFSLTGGSTGTCVYSGANWTTNIGISPTVGCPQDDLYGASALPITLPQPPGGECPACPAFIPDRVDLQTVHDLAGLENLTVGVERFQQWTYYPLGPRSGTDITVYLPPNTLDTNVTRMTLSYAYDAQPQMMYVDPIYKTW